MSDSSITRNEVVKACAERLGRTMNQRGVANIPIPLPITATDKEAEGVVTLWVVVPKEFTDRIGGGMFCMLWNPYDSKGTMSTRHLTSEKPYSISAVEGWGGTHHSPQRISFGPKFCTIGFTIKELGRQSGELNQAKEGDWLAVKGPFGNQFPSVSKGERVLLVGGGIGVAPLHLAAQQIRNQHGDGVEIEALLGFKEATEIHFEERMNQLCDSVTICTDDGSSGHHGFPTELIPNVLEENRVSRIFTCGPAPLMLGVSKVAHLHGVEVSASIENHLPCGLGLCGQCETGGRLTCREGPVMEGDFILRCSQL